jgi:phosphodiesterase/alkaline phosphatase D-like protein
MNERNDMDAVLCLGDYIYEYETEDILPTLLLIDFGSLKTKQQRFQIIELVIRSFRSRFEKKSSIISLDLRLG